MSDSGSSESESESACSVAGGVGSCCSFVFSGGPGRIVIES